LAKNAALVALCIALFLPAPSAVHADTSTSAVVIRTVNVSEWGSLIVTDEVHIRNNSTEPISTVSLGFPTRYLDHLSFYSAKSGNERLSARLLGNQSSNIFFFEVNFPPVATGRDYTFTLYTIFDEVVRFQVNRFNYTFSAFPTVSLRVDYYNGTIVLPVDAKTGIPRTEEPGSPLPVRVTKVGFHPAVNYVVRVPSSSVIQFHFNFTSLDQKLIAVDWAARQIEFNEDGSIWVRDGFKVTNRGRTLDAMPIHLPRGATEVAAYDTAGPIRYIVQEKGPTALTNVTVMPRFKEIAGNQSFSFSVQYRLPESGYVQVLDWGRYGFRFDLAPSLEGTVRALNVTILSPAGFRIENVTRSPTDQALKALGSRVEYRLASAPQIEDTSFQLTYRYSSFWAGFRPFGWVALTEAVVFGLVEISRRNRARAQELVPPTVSTDVLTQFVELCDEKSALRGEVERMEAELARGGLSKHEFRTRRKSIDLRLSGIERDLRSIKSKLREDARYGEMIQRLDRAEGELEAARVSQGQIRAQYRAGRITRESYEAIAQELRKRFERARQAIDSVIISIRDEIR